MMMAGFHFGNCCNRLAKALGLAVFSAALITQAATAQEMPPLVRIVVPMAAGGPADFVARNMAEALKAETGSNVIVENKPGANGAIAASAVSRAKADGSTLLFATSGLLTITPHIDTGLQIELGRDITPITPVVTNGTALLVNPALGVTNMKEFVEYVKASDKPVALGSAGVGNILHLYIELLKDTTGLQNIIHAPYKGISAAVTDALGGTIAGVFVDLPAALPQMESGALKAIGLVGTSRNPAVPDLPTIAEQGYPGIVGASWFGLFGPAGMTPELTGLLNDKVAAAMSSPDLKGKLTALGSIIEPKTAEAFSEVIAQDRKSWGEVVRKHKITAGQ
jgi:tripartite-type tricarboxylate transporter receptor subunit TctC